MSGDNATIRGVGFTDPRSFGLPADLFRRAYIECPHLANGIARIDFCDRICPLEEPGSVGCPHVEADDGQPDKEVLERPEPRPAVQGQRENEGQPASDDRPASEPDQALGSGSEPKRGLIPGGVLDVFGAE